jgi:hypothetical protein
VTHKLVNVTMSDIFNVSGEYFQTAAREIMKGKVPDKAGGDVRFNTIAGGRFNTIRLQ